MGGRMGGGGRRGSRREVVELWPATLATFLRG